MNIHKLDYVCSIRGRRDKLSQAEQNVNMRAGISMRTCAHLHTCIVHFPSVTSAKYLPDLLAEPRGL